MPIRFALEPPNGTETVRAGLDRMALRQNKPPALQAVDLDAATIAPPHAIYDIYAADIASGGGLETARPTGFRYLVTVNGGSIAAAEVHTDPTGRASLLANLNYGPFVDSTARGLAQIAALDAVSAADYEARVLRFSAVGLMAIWLKADTGGTDIIYPLPPAPPMLTANQPYTPEAFLNAVRPLAQIRAANTAGPAVP